MFVGLQQYECVYVTAYMVGWLFMHVYVWAHYALIYYEVLVAPFLFFLAFSGSVFSTCLRSFNFIKCISFNSGKWKWLTVGNVWTFVTVPASQPVDVYSSQLKLQIGCCILEEVRITFLVNESSIHGSALTMS